MKEVAIFGLGYVGLPLAQLCSRVGHEVTGIDTNAGLLSLVRAGKAPSFSTTENEELIQTIFHRKLRLSDRASDAGHCEVYLVCVPTPVDEHKMPDSSILLAAVREIARLVQPGNLVLIESTVFPGTCEQLVIPVLERESGLKVGVDIQVAHCPERVNPGDPYWRTENIPRVLGSTTEAGARAAADFYSSILGSHVADVAEGGGGAPTAMITMMKSIRDAEAVKAMENTIRDINIAVVNELAQVAEVLELDMLDIIRGMATKPFGKGPYYPGIGVGGHCIAVDPEWLRAASEKAGFDTQMIPLARQINNNMPGYTLGLINKAAEALALPMAELQIAIVGVSYKKNVPDARESPFYQIRDLIRDTGAGFEVYDPLHTAENTTDSLDEAIAGSQIVLIVTDHDTCVRQLEATDLDSLGVRAVIDGRNCLRPSVVTDQGVYYQGIGRSGTRATAVESCYQDNANFENEPVVTSISAG